MADQLIEGTKSDGGKPRFDLLSSEWLYATSCALTFGAEKYDAWNWAKGIKYSRVFSALMRHLWSWWRGEEFDAESGISHLAHASCCLMFLTHYDIRSHSYIEFDDRYIY